MYKQEICETYQFQQNDSEFEKLRDSALHGGWSRQSYNIVNGY